MAKWFDTRSFLGPHWVATQPLSRPRMQLREAFFLLVMLAPERALIVGSAVWGSAAKLVAPDGEPGDLLGTAVALRGGVALVAALDDDAGDHSGSVHAFERQESGEWLRTFKLAPADAVGGDEFGAAVAIDANAERAVVGARHGSNDDAQRTGTAYVFERQPGSTWLERIELMADAGSWGSWFGSSVALDGDRVVVGAPKQIRNGYNSAGAAFVFERQANGVWLQTARLLPSDSADSFGHAVALQRGTVVVGAPSAGGSSTGASYVFERQPDGTWAELVKLMAADSSGGDYFGCSVTLGGDNIVVGAHGSAPYGAAYVFAPEAGSWTQSLKLLPADGRSGDQFGYTVAIGDDAGATLGIGSQQCPESSMDCGNGLVNLYTRQESGQYVEAASFGAHDGASRDRFGHAVALDGDVVVVGAPDGDDAGLSSGTAYVFVPCTNYASARSVESGSCTACIGGAAARNCIAATCSAGYEPFDSAIGLCCSSFDSVASVLPGSCTSCSGDRPAECLAATCASGFSSFQVRKRIFLRHFILNMIILPRQAQDKHRENSTTEAFSATSRPAEASAAAISGARSRL